MTVRETLLDTLRPDNPKGWVACPEIEKWRSQKRPHPPSCVICSGSGRVPVLTRLGLVERCPTVEEMGIPGPLGEGQRHWSEGQQHPPDVYCSGWALLPAVAALPDGLLERLALGAIFVNQASEDWDGYDVDFRVSGWLEAQA